MLEQSLHFQKQTLLAAWAQIAPPKSWWRNSKFLVLGLFFLFGLVFVRNQTEKWLVQPSTYQEKSQTFGDISIPTEITAPTELPTSVPNSIALTPPSQVVSPVTIETIFYQSFPSWQTYTDLGGDFSIQYPEKYRLMSSLPGERVTFCYYDAEYLQGCSPTQYSISIYRDYYGGSRRIWHQNKFGTFNRPYFQDVIVAGTKALIVMDGNIAGSTGSNVLIPKGDKMYVFSFPYGWNPDTKELSGLDFIKQILATFQYME